MKFVLILCVLGAVTQGKVLPERLSNLLCRKSELNYAECALQNFQNVLPIITKGIPELGLPSIDPVEIPFVRLNRTISELVSINAVLKNVKSTGLSNFIVDDLKADPEKLSSELRVTLPWSTLDMEYEVTGQLLQIPLRSRGLFNGNFTNTQMYIKGNLKTIDKNGVKYYKVDKLNMKIRVGDGRIKLTAHNPNLQFAADLISDFYNENPRLAMDAVNPIFVEFTTELYRAVLDRILDMVPAKEWFAE